MVKQWLWFSLLVIAAIALRLIIWVGSSKLVPESIDDGPIFFILAIISSLGEIIPAFIAGWFYRRNSAIAGFVVGAVASMLIGVQFHLFALNSYSLLGQAVASGMESALIAFAAQALRSRLPPNNSFKPTPHRGVGHVPTLR